MSLHYTYAGNPHREYSKNSQWIAAVALGEMYTHQLGNTAEDALNMTISVVATATDYVDIELDFCEPAKTLARKMEFPRKPCSELASWAQNVPEACSSSKIGADGVSGSDCKGQQCCFKQLTHSSATYMCAKAGGRLCTFNELRHNVGKGAGCYMDTK